MTWVNLNNVYLPQAGGTVTGNLQVNGNLTINDKTGKGTLYNVASEITALRDSVSRNVNKDKNATSNGWGIIAKHITSNLYYVYISKTFDNGISKQYDKIQITMPFKPVFTTNISARLMVANVQVGVGRAIFSSDGSIIGSWDGYGAAVTIEIYGCIYISQYSVSRTTSDGWEILKLSNGFGYCVKTSDETIMAHNAYGGVYYQQYSITYPDIFSICLDAGVTTKTNSGLWWTSMFYTDEYPTVSYYIVSATNRDAFTSAITKWAIGILK